MPTVSVTNCHELMPSSSTTGYVGVPSVMRMNFANTTYMTQNSINGLSTDHATPRNDPW